MRTSVGKKRTEVRTIKRITNFLTNTVGIVARISLGYLIELFILDEVEDNA